MRVAVTGTPGVGKTTATGHLSIGLEVLHLNDVIEDAGLYDGRDAERGSNIADLDALGAWLDDRQGVLFESHLAHHFPADRVVVLRCHPEELSRRLRQRGESQATVRENAEAEALDVILAEAVDRYGADRVYEIDGTDRSPSEIAAAIEAVVAGRREPTAGTVSFIEYL